MSYEIKIPLFEGPFDLLLFFIERDELDIMDIPISQITNDFFEYISDLEKMNIEVASEFIVVAATLMRIKSRMLLPRLSVDEEGNEIDPREELVEHLIEYKKYKSVINDFSKLEEHRQEKISRGNLFSELNIISERAQVETELQDIDLYKLLVVFKNALDNSKINEVTEPFESSFGWHIAEVLDRRSEDVSIEIQKNKAYRILFERKFQEQLETSLQEMRSQSFVEIKKRT